MEEGLKPVYEWICKNRGLTLEEITALAGAADTVVLDAQLKELIEKGYVSFYLGRLYPNIWTVGIVPKGERHTAVEIELEGLTIDHIRGVMAPFEGDPLFFDSYPIEEAQKPFFKEAAGIDFDEDHFDYYLLSGFNNSDE